MICHSYKCIFLHQRKCAGTAIKACFDLDKELPERSQFNEGPLSIDPEWSLKRERYDDYFTFSVVRNPFDKFVSAWKYLDATRESKLADVLDDLPEAGHDFRHLTRSQWEILYDDDGTLVADFLIRYEHLQSDFDRVCDIIGKARMRLPVKKKGRRLPYRWYFRRRRDVKKFRNIYAKDFALWKNAAAINAKRLRL